MLLGKVIGTVVSTRKEASIEGLTLLLVQACDVDGVASGATIVAADAVGAGIGEVVLCASGSSARQTEVTQQRPIDAAVMAIVDLVEAGGQPRYTKG